MQKLLIIADDLTGANDTGVQLAKKGIPVFVSISEAGDLWHHANKFQVLVVNTESRHLSMGEAAERVRAVTQAALAEGMTRFYKKIDSSLRGNIGGELEALMSAARCSILPFIPAFPKLQRTTLGGYHYVDGKLLHQTMFASDPLEPIAESFIPSLLKRQTSVPTKLIPRVAAQHSYAPLNAADHGIYVFDACSDEDLRCIGEHLKNAGLLGAVAGSAGFAEQLPDLMELEKHPAKWKPCGGNMLVISGSVNEISLRQLAHAEARGFAVVTVPPEVLVSETGSQSARALSAINELTAHAARRNDVILRSVEKAEDVAECLRLGQKLGLEAKQLHLRIAKNLGQIGAQILKKTNFKLISVFGGDTLMALARALVWTGLLPRAEIMPGIIVAEVAEREGELLLMTKAGGFGQENVLVQMKHALGSIKQ